MSTINRERIAPTSQQLLIASLLILWLGFFIRLHNLGSDSFWIDEILTVNDSRGGLGSFLKVRDHPPLTYAVTSIALEAWGENEFSARIPAFIAGVLALPLIILLGKLLKWPVAVLWAALLLALSPVHIAYSQQARHYALLLVISLATYIVLYRALTKPRWSFWIGFAILSALNLYNHYGAVLVLISQVILIAGWLLGRAQRHRPSGAWHIWRYPVMSGFLLILLYLPWLSRLPAVASHNLVQDTAAQTGGVASLTEWAGRLFRSFGMIRGSLPFLILLLVLVGLATLVWRRRWLKLGLIASATLLPLLLIQLFQVSRGVYSRYVLYMLPFYLLVAALGLTALLEILVRQRFGLRAYVSASAVLAALLLLVAWPRIMSSYQRIQEDWRGILGYLAETAAEGDVLVGASMNYRNQFNLVSASLPYYLNDDDSDYLWLPAGQFGLDEASALAGHQGGASVVAFDWNQPAALSGSTMDIEPFQTALFVGRQPSRSASSLDNTIALYEELLAVVAEIDQACLFKEDLAFLLLADGQTDSASARLDQIQKECPNLVDQTRFMSARVSALRKKLDNALADGRHQEAESIALELLQYRPGYVKALDTLTAFNLLQQWSIGEANVNEKHSPEPVRAMQFTMPREGDAREVLLIHPPASVTYRLTLPEGKPVLRTRLALAPRSWSWGGDGATFVAYIEPVEGSRQEILRRHVNNDAQDHVWHVVIVSLEEYAGEDVRLTLTTEAGPSGDATGDWAGWETPRILRLQP